MFLGISKVQFPSIPTLSHYEQLDQRPAADTFSFRFPQAIDCLRATSFLLVFPRKLRELLRSLVSFDSTRASETTIRGKYAHTPRHAFHSCLSPGGIRKNRIEIVLATRNSIFATFEVANCY